MLTMLSFVVLLPMVAMEGLFPICFLLVDPSYSWN